MMLASVPHLPYLTTGTEGMWERYVSTPGGLLLPWWLPWVERLPGWARTFYLGKTPWQWAAMALSLLVIFAVPRGVSRWRRSHHTLAR